MGLIEQLPLKGEIIPPGPAIDYWPHPITSDHRCEIYAAEGQTLDEVMACRLPPGLDAVAVVNGALVARQAWHTVTLRRDDVVQVRVRVARGGGGSNPIAVILSIAIIIAAPYLAAAIAPALGITSAIGLSALTFGIQAVGLLVVNSLFPPRLPDPPSLEGQGQPSPQYSLSGGANRARPHEPLLMLLGQHRMYPDVVAAEYTEYDENSDQFLNGIYDYGIGELDLGGPRFGETPLANFDSVTTQSQVDAVTLVAGNVDTIAGGEFEAAYPDGRMNGSPWVTRRTAGNTTCIGFDLVSMHFLATSDGTLEGRTAFFRVEWKPVSASMWTGRNVDIVSPDGADARNPVRRTVSTGRIAANAYDVRVRIRANYDEDDDLSRITYRAAAPTIKAHQDETADFSGRNALAVRAKATGQLYGRLDRINADVGAEIPDWNGTDWNTVRVTSNPASILLWWFRGYRVDGTLRAGYGLDDDQIDFPSLQRWHAFCQPGGRAPFNDPMTGDPLPALSCNIVISDTRNEDEIAMLIAQCGWARVDISTGKYGVVFEEAGKPVTAIITPANIVAGSISVSYDNENLADEIIGTYLDADSDYQENSLRRPVPQFTVTGEFPVTIRLEGITDGKQAAMEINRAAAAQFYHQRQIVWEMDDEGRPIGIGDVLGMANGLIGQGQGGRLITISGDRQTVGTPFEVEAASGSCWVWLLDDTVLATTWTRTAEREIRLAAALGLAPEGVTDHPTAYRIMLFAATDPYTKVRVTGIDAVGPHRFRFTARDELQQYYDFRHSDLTAPLIPIKAIERPCPTGFTVTQTTFGSRYYAWNEPTVPFTGFELRYGAVGADWDAMTPLHEGLVSGSPWTSEDRPDQGTWRFAIVAVYPDGRRCDPVYTQSTVTAPGRVTLFKEVEIYRVLAVTAAAPERPGANEGSYDFDTETLTPPDDWLAGPQFPTFNQNQQVWACTATADSAEGLNWVPDEDDWVGPFVVGDANDLDIIYRRLAAPPTEAPDPSEGIPSGWHTNVADVPTGVDPIYISIGHRPRSTRLYIWQLPTQLEGQSATSYRELDAYMVVAATAAAPATPGASGSYNFNTNIFTPPTGWMGPAFPAYTHLQKVYAVTTTADDASGRTWNAEAGDWLPNPPVVVGSADDLNVIYRRFETVPTTAPAASAGVPTGWYDRVSSVPSGAGLIYQSIGHRVRGMATYTWQRPTQLEVVSITSVVRNAATGVVTITYTDGRTDMFTVTDGESPAALTVQSVETDDRGNVTITFSDGTTATIAAGNAGRGIQSISRNLATGIVTVTYDDGTSDTFALDDGMDGADGSSQEWIYRATTTDTAPDTPVGENTNDFVPTGWSDDPVSGAYVWVSTRRKPAGTNSVWGAFSTPVPFKGEPGEAGPPGPRIWQQLWSGTQAIDTAEDGVGISWSGGLAAADYDDFGVAVDFVSDRAIAGAVRRFQPTRVIGNNSTFVYDQIFADGDDSIGIRRSGTRSVRVRVLTGSLSLRELWGIKEPGSSGGRSDPEPTGGTLTAVISGPASRTLNQAANYTIAVGGTATGDITYNWQWRAGTSGDRTPFASRTSTFDLTQSTAGTWQVRCVINRGGVQAISNEITTVWAAAGSTRTRTFYQRGSSAPAAPTSAVFGAYTTPGGGWGTSDPGATSTQDVYEVTLTQSFSSQTQSSGTFTGNSWSSVTLHEARAGTSSRMRTFYQRGTTAPAAPTSAVFGAYTSPGGGWGTSDPAATATQGVYQVTLTQTFNHETQQDSSTFASNSWSSVTLHEAATGTAPSAPDFVRGWTSTYSSSTFRNLVAMRLNNAYPSGLKAHWQLSDSADFSNPTDIYGNTEVSLSGAYWNVRVSGGITASMHVRGRLTTGDNGTGQASSWVVGDILS